MTNQDEKITIISNSKYVHMFYNKDNFFLYALLTYFVSLQPLFKIYLNKVFITDHYISKIYFLGNVFI